MVQLPSILQVCEMYNDKKERFTDVVKVFHDVIKFSCCMLDDWFHIWLLIKVFKIILRTLSLKKKHFLMIYDIGHHKHLLVLHTYM